MRIKRMAVHDLLSLRDTGEFSVDPQITLLLGKNENGKTNLLKALHWFDRSIQFGEEDLCRYGKTRAAVEAGEISPGDVPLVTIWFGLDNEDRKTRLDVHLPAAPAELKAVKFLDNHYSIELDGVPLEVFAKSVPQSVPAEAIRSEMAGRTKKLREDLILHTARTEPFKEGEAHFQKALDDFGVVIDEESGSTTEALDQLQSRLTALPNQDAPVTETINEGLSALSSLSAKLEAILKPEGGLYEEVLELLPKFVYFSEIDLLEDRVSIADFIAKTDQFGTLRHLVELANLDVSRLQSQQPFQRRESAARASATVTGLLNESWSQEQVTLELSVDGADLLVVVRDERGGFDPPSARSQGFQWFLGFYINFTFGSRGEFRNTILLLDDPGVHLHASGQRDLLRTIKTLANQNQFLIATHSPFLIDRQKLDRIRIVEKQPKRRGTTVHEKWHRSEADAFEPIRAALGMTIGDTLFADQKNVIVEGVSDYMILAGMSAVCQRLGKAHLDLDKLAILGVGGADNVPYWTLLLFKQQLPVVALLDHDTQGRKAHKVLTEDLAIDERLAMTLGGFATPPDCTEVVLEDLIGVDFYHRAFGMAYDAVLKEKSKQAPKVSELTTSPCSRIAPYKEFFKKQKLGNFDKTAVARAVQVLCTDLATDQTAVGIETIEKFSRLFEVINAALDAEL